MYLNYGQSQNNCKYDTCRWQFGHWSSTINYARSIKLKGPQNILSRKYKTIMKYAGWPELAHGQINQDLGILGALTTNVISQFNSNSNFVPIQPIWLRSSAEEVHTVMPGNLQDSWHYRRWITTSEIHNACRKVAQHKRMCFGQLKGIYLTP